MSDTLNVYDNSEKRTPTLIAYGISPLDSNAMKSGNPESGIYQADTSRTLDNNGGNPACNQGGLMVVSINENGTRESNHGGFSRK